MGISVCPGKSTWNSWRRCGCEWWSCGYQFVYTHHYVSRNVLISHNHLKRGETSFQPGHPTNLSILSPLKASPHRSDWIQFMEENPQVTICFLMLNSPCKFYIDQAAEDSKMGAWLCALIGHQRKILQLETTVWILMASLGMLFELISKGNIRITLGYVLFMISFSISLQNTAYFLVFPSIVMVLTLYL